MTLVAPDWPDIRRRFERALGKERLVQRREQLLAYDADGLTLHRQAPELVVLPTTAEEVRQAVALCHRLGVPFVARGSGTGLSGGAVPPENAVVIATSRMRRILAVDLDNQTITVEPGVVNSWVTRAVQGDGFYFAPDPSSQVVCSVGGNVAENSSGVHCLKYGVTSSHVLGLDVVLPDGTTSRFGGALAEMPGLDLRGLFIGSEGTLGIATAITLRLLRAPEAVRVLLAEFSAMEAAGEAVSAITAAGILPAGMEIMDRLSINAAEDLLRTGCYDRDSAAALLVELDGQNAEVALASRRAADLCRGCGAVRLQLAETRAERERLWKGRKSAFAAMGRVTPDYYVQDGVVPRSTLPRVLAAIEALSDRSGIPIANVFHAGDGNLHPLLLYDRREPGIVERVEALGADILRLCLSVGGSITGEHGVGSDKRDYMGLMFKPEDLDTMQLVRRAIDPRRQANPTKIFPTPSSCAESSRLGARAVSLADLPVF
ncbi:MAG: FAD-binding protein [Aphanocapsa feldmannii 277cV]|uniref:FAD-binding protein n=2 Tax=Aphanocapsa feldmannii TaxID=192050 RepID=A0A524RPS2_9CHRO|nr:MAG: FAD-binding protein [Aphanocapsa feldmannii 277cV]TGH21191.1 MAG: FAD-binding protein [Aphanocapsa feldmannii 277cI]